MPETTTASEEYGSALRTLAPLPIIQAFFMLVYAVWWSLAWPGWGTAAFVLTAIYAIVVVILSVRNIRHSRQFENIPTEDGRRIGRQMGTLMGITYGLVWIAILTLALTGQFRWILPAVATLIALHFFPFVRIFDRKIDYPLAPIALTFALVGLWLAAQNAIDWLVVFAVTGIGGAIATGVYAGCILLGYSQLASQAEQPE